MYKSNASLIKSQKWKANLKRESFKQYYYIQRDKKGTEVPLNFKLALQLDILFLKYDMLKIHDGINNMSNNTYLKLLCASKNRIK